MRQSSNPCKLGEPSHRRPPQRGRAIPAADLDENSGTEVHIALDEYNLIETESLDCNRPLIRLYSQETVSLTEHRQWYSLQWYSGTLKYQYQKGPERRQRCVVQRVTDRNDPGPLDIILIIIQSLNKC